jgi:hypothetical protein
VKFWNVVGITIVLSSSACAGGDAGSVSPSFGPDANRMEVHASPSIELEGDGSDPEESGPEPGEEFASPPAATIPADARVPDVRGMTFEDAVIALRTLGMNFGFVSARTSDATQWSVLEQSPDAGAIPPAGGRVSMTVSMGPGGAGLAGVGGVACRPEEDDIDEPYCEGKLFRY